MAKNKRKILFVSESVVSRTGFSKYYNEIMRRLYDSNKFEIADLSCYTSIEDRRLDWVKWKLYCNAVKPGDPRHNFYINNPINVHGGWRFNEVLLDFRPDIVFSARDFWYDTFILESPLRPFYYFAWCPTCDSEPIKTEWRENIKEADAIYAYNDWAVKIMREQTNNAPNIIGSASPGININIFSPAQNKIEQKKKMLFKSDINLIGMVARNQKRKLFPDLFIAFEDFLNYCIDQGNHDLAKKTYLFIHTSFPDAGWNISQLLKENNISHKVLFSYICKQCKKWFPAFYSDAITYCPFCDNLSAVLPNPEIGVSENQLADIYRSLDLYSHISICGGFEIPITEAAACGVPCMASDNTSMSDVVRKCNGIPLKLKHTFRELETNAYRHYTDIDYMIKEWYKFFTESNDYRIKQGELARQGVLDNYTWDKTAKILENHFENCELVDKQGKWSLPPNLIKPRINPGYEKLSNKEFLKYLILDVLQKPEELYKYKNLHILSVLNYGAEADGRKIRKIDRIEIHKAFLKIVERHNYYEEIRCGINPLPKHDFIEYANIRMTND